MMKEQSFGASSNSVSGWQAIPMGSEKAGPVPTPLANALLP